MPAAVFTNSGLQQIMDRLCNSPNFVNSGWRFRPFNNNVTPLVTSVVGDFTPSANAIGQSYYSGSNRPVVASVAGVNTVVFPDFSWVFPNGSIAETLFGYTFEIYVNPTWLLVAAAGFTPAPINVPAGGITITKNFSFSVQKLP